MLPIAEPLRDLIVDIGELSPHPKNPWNGDEDEVAASLARFGQVRPVLYQRSTGHILRGNTTYAAALSLGATVIAAVPMDVDDEEALRVLLNDNRTKDAGGYDLTALAAVMRQVDQSSGLTGTGYSTEDIAAVLELASDAPRTGEHRPSDIGPVNPLRRRVPRDDDDSLGLPELPAGSDLQQITLLYAREPYEQLVRDLELIDPIPDDLDDGAEVPTHTDTVLRLLGVTC